MGKEFIARTQQMGKILGGFITNSTDIFKDFTRLLGASLQNLMTFDFSDTSGRVKTAFDDLNLSVENWGTDFENAIKLITTPLSEGIASGEDARPLGTENTNEGAYETTAPYSGSPAPQVMLEGGISGTTALLPSGAKGADPYIGATDRFGYSSSRGRQHNGIDIGTTGQRGYYVAFLLDGTATLIPNLGNAGNVVEIKSGGTTYKFFHLARFSIKSGPYKAGTAIGEIGNTGTKRRAIDIHLHYEVHPPGTNGVNPEPYVNLIKIGKNLGKPTPAPVSVASSSTSQPQQNLMGTSSSSSGSGDVGPWKPLMNLIASKESAGGGYEALNPSTTLPGATKMTISEVAREAARVGPAKGGSGAVGKYQQLPRFLVGRAIKAGLNPDKDLFSPSNQDLIAAKVNIGMERFGNSWLAGKYPTEKFMQGLSQEFAVVPNAYGAFAYRGQSSSMTPQQVKAALEQVKKGGGSQTSSPSPAIPQSTPSPAIPQSTPAPAIPQSTPAPAQISSTGTPQNPQITQSLAQERTGPTVIVSQNPSSPARQMMSSGGGGSSGGGSSQISEFTLLNNFIKNKLLLDLAYL
jgi:hypothetical protein